MYECMYVYVHFQCPGPRGGGYEGGSFLSPDKNPKRNSGNGINRIKIPKSPKQLLNLNPKHCPTLKKRDFLKGQRQSDSVGQGEKNMLLVVVH